MENKNFFHSFIRFACGKKYILMITDAAEIMSRQQQLENDAQFKESYAKLAQSLRYHILSGGALALALSLSMQRYFPSKFSTFGLNRIMIDLALASVCLFLTTNMALETNNNEFCKIKKSLMLNYDKAFLKHMAELEMRYQIQEQNQIRGVFTQEQYKEWVSKRHQHIY